MSTPSELEARIGALINAYADRAPTFVDPVGMTRLAAQTRMHLRATRRQSIWPDRGLAAMLTAVALLVVVVLSTVIVGAQLIRDDPLTVIGREAREHGWVFVYSDGRVVGANGAYLFERSLTPEGLELIRSGAVPSSAILDDPHMSGSMITPRLLPQVLGPLLPESAWADPEIEPYRPSTYAVCALVGDQPIDLRIAVARLPDGAQAIIQASDRRSVAEVSFGSDVTAASTGAGCSTVTAAEARGLVRILGDAGFDLQAYVPDGILEPGSPGGILSKTGVEELSIQPVLPHGTWMPRGG